MKKALIAIVVLIIIGAGGWYLVSSGKLNLNQFTQPNGSANSATTTTTVATVNGENVSSAQLSGAIAQINAQNGTSTITTPAQVQTQALDSIIAQMLLVQAVKKSGIVASSTLVEAQIQTAKTQLGSQAAYDKALASQGMTEASLRAQINSNLAIQEYLNQTLNLSAVTATDAEIQSAYKQIAAQQANVPALSKVRDQVKKLVIQQKQQQMINAQVQKLRSEGDIKILI